MNNKKIKIDVKNEKIKDELNRRNLKILDLNIDLTNENKPQLTFNNLEYPYIEKVELIGNGFKYEPFKERCDEKFHEIDIAETNEGRDEKNSKI